MFRTGNGEKQHVCIVNVGHYRSGTTTLAEAARSLGMKAYRKFPNLSKEEHRDFLHNPEKALLDWAEKEDAMKEVVRITKDNDIVCDGWFALLPFAPAVLDRLKQEAKDEGVDLEFVATTRDVGATVQSELQHWVRRGLEDKAGLSAEERDGLESSLKKRTEKYYEQIKSHQGKIKLLALEDTRNRWPITLSGISDHTKEAWSCALERTGKQNANPPLPVEGILLTMRFGSNKKEAAKKICAVERLLDELEQDSLCRYLVVLGIDEDETANEAAKDLVQRLQSRVESNHQMISFHRIVNAPRSPDEAFPLCSIWNVMAVEAWKNGADWVVLMGDDVQVHCSYHYRAIYRSFLDIADTLNVEFGFGCPWWNDKTFPGFPTFPCVGKAHFDIFGGLIPAHRRETFVNQDLDPYLQCLYLKFRAAPCASAAVLTNDTGGNLSSGEARYERKEAEGWRDFVWGDIEPLRAYLPGTTEEALTLDVIVPSYRVDMNYLESICSLKAPHYLCVHFIVIVDNVDALLKVAAATPPSTQDSTRTLHQSERILEEHLSQLAGNIVRVRCNLTNRGASASRNRGLDESAAEFFLNLDDDLTPKEDLLEQYGSKMKEIESNPSIVGLVGLVRFPRSPTLCLKHAAVLMSYLTFMFEIAGRTDLYPNPAWGVTANILFRRTKVRFDEAYAKTGGGEDVDFSLRVAGQNGRLVTVPKACVVHPFWPGSVLELSSHFFNWAVGDGGLLKRFPEYRYWSFPNFPETFSLLGPWALGSGVPAAKLLMWIVFFLVSDLLVDCANPMEYKHRCSLLEHKRHFLFCFFAHVLANLYVVVLECGRLWGHLTRADLSGVCHRFDWHCGRLSQAPRNFRKREACKFISFCLCVGLYESFLVGGMLVQWRPHRATADENCSVF